MKLSAAADYAVRAALELAAADPGAVHADRLAAAQDVPPRFLVNILGDLRRAGLVRSQRGADGGYRLARPPAEITIADVIRSVQGSLGDVHGERPEAVSYAGPAERLPEVWVAARAAYREVLEQVTLAGVVRGALPRTVTRLAAEPDAWRSWPER